MTEQDQEFQPKTIEELKEETGMTSEELIEHSSIDDNKEPVEEEPVIQDMLTTAPLTPEVIDLFITGKYHLVMDYTHSALKGNTFFDYMALHVPNYEMSFGTDENQMEIMTPTRYEEYEEVMLGYLNTTKPAIISAMRVMTASLLLYVKGLAYEKLSFVSVSKEFMDQFKEKYPDIIAKWIDFADSFITFPIYGISVLKDHFEPEKHLPIINDENAISINAMSLLNVPQFTEYYFSLDTTYKAVIYAQQFSQLDILGHTMTGYFRQKENVLCNVFEALANGLIKMEDIPYPAYQQGALSKDYPTGPFVLKK